MPPEPSRGYSQSASYAPPAPGSPNNSLLAHAQMMSQKIETTGAQAMMSMRTSQYGQQPAPGMAPQNASYPGAAAGSVPTYAPQPQYAQQAPAYAQQAASQVPFQFNQIDADGDGQISRQEFARAMAGQNQMAYSQAQQAYNPPRMGH
ncbi:unnamed protein product [Polarella glacialis]|uniref:EF-hand domain-containing protein n=1 Tax=Polarella glacialis TaxID=89957 RepID=A0A813IDV6_POLGL|nr:unnamed protein product [Polarella glacialis]